MSTYIETPQVVAEAFPALSSARFIKRLASSVPLIPDTTFDIFQTAEERPLALITTDHPDPKLQSDELHKVSGVYKAASLAKPFEQDAEINITEHDEIADMFFVKKEKVYYYVANLESLA